MDQRLIDGVTIDDGPAWFLQQISPLVIGYYIALVYYITDTVTQDVRVYHVHYNTVVFCFIPIAM